jgi:uncharacterized protein (DUF983 family)
MNESGWLPQPVFKSALLGLCPRCGAPGMFTRVIRFSPRCPQCKLDYASFDVGDAAAPFLIFLVGAVVVCLAIWLELSRSPPWWVHVLLWVPLTVGLTVLLLRIAKGILLVLEQRHDARLGRHE